VLRSRFVTVAFGITTLVVLAWGSSDLAAGRWRAGGLVMFFGLFGLYGVIGRVLDVRRPRRSRGPELLIGMFFFLAFGTLAVVSGVTSRDFVGAVLGVLLLGFAAFALYAWWTTMRRRT
jgi:hypothetical protein